MAEKIEPHPAMHGLGSRIKMLRLSKGWTQERLAEEAKISQGSVSAYERQERAALPLAHAMRLADALTVPIQFLAYGAEIDPNIAARFQRPQRGEVEGGLDDPAAKKRSL